MHFEDENLVKRLVLEGRRVGKCPWCCSFTHENAARFRLAKDIGKGWLDEVEQETMEETCERRKIEAKQHGIDVEDKNWGDKWRILFDQIEAEYESI